MIFDAALLAAANFTLGEVWLYLLAGVLIGIMFGAIPGIDSMLALSLVVPFVFGMELLNAIVLMISILGVQFLGASVSAILINVPGTIGSSATLLDGYPMSRKGEAGRALGAALTASALGSVFTVVVALAFIPLLLPMIFALRTADMVSIIVLGLTFIAVLGTGSMFKGLIAGGLGLLLSFIGHQLVGGADRFTFGSLYLYDGIPVVPLVLALFAVPEMVVLAASGDRISQGQIAVAGRKDVIRGMRDTIRNWKLVIRCSTIGYIVGSVPGVGGSVAAFVAYGHAKQISDRPEEFGTGVVEGVIGPESANDAKEGGALLTTLALGIPGSSPYAIILAALIILGLKPGPEMLTNQLDVSLTALLAILISSVIGALIILSFAGTIARVANVPARYLAPLILTMVFVGTYFYRERIEDLFMILVLSVFGLIMKKYGFNRPALFLGFILGKLFENYFFIALEVDGPLFFTTPISLAVIAITIISLSYVPAKLFFKARQKVRTMADD